MIGIRTARLAVALLLAAAPVAASAQAVTDIKFGQTLTKKAGTKVDLYRFVGGSGTTIKATLTAPGKAALILYTPAGEEMLTAHGTGTVTLEAILPLWDVFFIGVVRVDGAKSYSLKLNGDEPDAHLALFARKVGFAFEAKDEGKPYLVSTCWIEPGVTLRRTWPRGIEEVALGRGGKQFTKYKLNGGEWKLAEGEVRFEGDAIIYHRTDGSKPDQTRSREKLLTAVNRDKFESYLCDPGS